MYGEQNHALFPHMQKCIEKKMMPDFRICRNVWRKQSCPISAYAEMYGEKKSWPISAYAEMYGEKKTCPISAYAKMYGKKNHARLEMFLFH